MPLGQSDIYITKHGEIGLDDMGALLAAFPQYAKRAVASALRSEGFRMRGELQDAIMQGGPDSASWPALHEKTGIMSIGGKNAREGNRLKNFKMVWQGEEGSRKRVKQYGVFPMKWRRRNPGRSGPLSKLRGGLRYVFRENAAEHGGQPAVDVGFVKSSSHLLRIVRGQAQGFSTTITPRMRRFAFAMGFPLKSGTNTLRTPKRELIGPVYQEQEAQIRANLGQKYLNNILRYIASAPNGSAGIHEDFAL